MRSSDSMDIRRKTEIGRSETEVRTLLLRDLALGHGVGFIPRDFAYPGIECEDNLHVVNCGEPP